MPRFVARLVLMLTLVLGTLGTTSAQTVTYFHNDIAGTPMLATDAAGAVVWKENYLPYGYRQVADPASGGNKLWFTGKAYDPETQLSYMGARYYMPLLGRFTGIDPVGIVPEQPHSFNRYAYANNNPYKYVDPDGRYVRLAIVVGGTVFAIALADASITPELRSMMAASASQAKQRLSEAISQVSSWVLNESSEEAKTNGPKIHDGQQGKHVKGHNNFDPERSELTHPNPQELLDRGSGTGEQVGPTPLGQPGSKERVDFGEKIGNYTDPVTGEKAPTSIGIIHNGSRGSHIVPARPKQ